MARSPSKLDINFAEETHKINENMDMITNKCQTCGINYKDCKCFLKYTNVKDNLIV